MQTLARCICSEPTETNLKFACGLCGGFNPTLDQQIDVLIVSSRTGMKSLHTKDRIMASNLNPKYD